MKKGLRIALLLILIIALSGCAPANQQEDSPQISVYYAYTNDRNDTGLSVGSERRSVDSGTDILKAAVEAVMGKPQNFKLASPFTEGVKLESYKLEKGTLSLYMSDKYAEMPAGNKIIARSCLALTLCAVEGVENISVFVGDIPDVTGLTAEKIISENSDLNPYEKRLKLYFSNGKGLVPEYRNVTVNEDRELAASVMEELLKGPRGAGLSSVMPAGTRLLSINVENGLCTVNLSSEFLENRPDNESAEALTIYSIVNSLTTLTKISKVQFLINDERVDTYLSIGIFYPIEGKEIPG